MKQIWWKKHIPNNIDGFIFQNDDQKRQIERIIDQKDMPHLLLHGVKGTGKTALANLLIKSLIQEEHTPYDVLYIDGSDDTHVETIRTKVKSHINTMPHGELKIVFIDEADHLSKQAQAALRTPTGTLDNNARFILACNYVNKLTTELRSRFTEMKFNKLDEKVILEKCVEILLEENVDVTKEDFPTIKEHINLYYPDIRKIIGSLQNSIEDNKVISPSLDDNSLQYKLELFDLLNKDDWDTAREIVCKNATDDEWEDIYRFLYEHLYEMEKFKMHEKWKKGIVIISDHLYRHSFFADKEINFAACMIRLSEV